MQNPYELLADYSSQIKHYQHLAAEVADRLKHLTRQVGLRPIITHRPKDIRSLIKKCLLYNGTVDETPDRAGVKVVVRYKSEAEVIKLVIQSDAFLAEQPDVKAARLKPNEMGYLGTHYQVRLPPEGCPSDLIGLECEIIVHTGAESLWDSIAHELTYKPLLELPELSQRSLLRLTVLVELFDKEVSDVRAEYVKLPSYREAFMLDILEKYFFRFDPCNYQKEMSIRTLEALAPLVSADKIQRFDDEIATFVDEHKDTLHAIYQRYQEDDDLRGLFLHQPESLLIFAMFEWQQKNAVKNAWLSLYPRQYLEALGSMWAVTIPR